MFLHPPPYIYVPIVFIGTDDIASVCLSSLRSNIENTFEICDVDSIEVILSKYNLVNVLISNRNPLETAEKLKPFHYKIKNIWFYDGISIIHDFNTDFYIENMLLFQDIYCLLADQKSKQVFEAYILSKISRDYRYTMQTEAYGQYIDSELLDLSEKKVFVECGGYLGEDIPKLAKAANFNYKKIYSLEADINNYRKEKQIIKNSHFENVIVLNVAAWSDNTILNFNNIEQDASKSSFTIQKGTTTVSAAKIDDIIKEPCDYIKMDIEGAEYEALLGAEQIIKRDKPLLAICVYHKQDDLIKLIPLIKSYRKDYTFYLRNYNKFPIELVVYAI